MEIFIGLLILAGVIWVISGFFGMSVLLEDWGVTTWRHDMGWRLLMLLWVSGLWIAVIAVLLVAAWAIGSVVLNTGAQT